MYDHTIRAVHVAPNPIEIEITFIIKTHVHVQYNCTCTCTVKPLGQIYIVSVLITWVSSFQE